MKKIIILVFFVAIFSKNASSVQFDNKFDLKISLQKDTFKMYEPVHVLFQYVNKSDVNDTIGSEFNDLNDFVKFNINGNNLTYSSPNMPEIGLVVKTSQYILKPNDTLLVSKRLNFNYGKKFSGRGYFSMNGYFLPGKYRFFAVDVIKGKEYKTNELDFNVTELNKEDSTLLGNWNMNNLDMYKNNPLAEAELVLLLFAYYPNHNSNEKYSPSAEDIITLYSYFFDNFSQSYFNYNYAFVYSYLAKLMFKGYSVPDEIEKLKVRYKDSSLFKFLNNVAVTGSLISGYNEWKNSIGK